jgi:hypothetical protein
VDLTVVAVVVALVVLAQTLLEVVETVVLDYNQILAELQFIMLAAVVVDQAHQAAMAVVVMQELQEQLILVAVVVEIKLDLITKVMVDLVL